MATTETAVELTAEELGGQLFEAGVAFGSVIGAYLGDRLGLYAALRELGTATAAELGAKAGVAERYAREWLEHQATYGFVRLAGGGDDPAKRRFAFLPATAEVFLEPESLNGMAPLARALVGVVAQLPAVAEAFRTGGGVPYGAYGPDVIEAQAAMNRPAFVHLLGNEWLPSIPDIDARLRVPGARVADIGCGAAWSSIAIARAYPGATVDGFDTDPASVELAGRNVAEAGLRGRVHVQLADAATVGPGSGGYDLVAALETMHDMANPVAVLRAARGLIRPGGTMLVMDENVEDTFRGAQDNPLEKFFYTASLGLCLPTGMADQPSAGTGTVMRPATLEAYAREAGFSSVQGLPIEFPFFRFYRLDP